ncbi:MAG: anaerobic ribonucleoside-triphosphate reductase activating protein [Microbacterium sp. SCN 70-27]|uniref:anaerobic ribonucleoside-triphosphate reductase activating protein n=1 Tax=unclassified Microbacterium TaxID=2609290 RepID=UPI000869B248|nr:MULTISPECIES: anaerobic ribonucleoside-triphosphate reductase activating protein [unclassified Microbacterium]MBN9225434.1 anaerobic ribonucleoside-triphosphate reductase activating protein [Microbacterium sp.]ODT27607.1 MAG: anaerobic ribonucleoside-triphosphate reductase activating protein [Microbacterium sp. SCN 70-27]
MVRAAAAYELNIAGITPFSTVDWPDTLAATVFLQGCPWSCFYCHNPALIDPRAEGEYSWSDVVDLLCDRIGLVDGVVFSGGEPTLQRALIPAMEMVHALGFQVGLHTAGAYPGLLAQALPHVDWVGLDIKALPGDYDLVTGRQNSANAPWRSLELVLGNRLLRAGTDRPLDFEVRTTVHPGAIDDARLRELGCRLADAGVDCWAVQRFRETGARNPLPRVQAAADADAPLTLDDLPVERFASLVVR